MILNGIIAVGFTEKVPFEHRFEGSGGVSQEAVCKRAYQSGNGKFKGIRANLAGTF